MLWLRLPGPRGWLGPVTYLLGSRSFPLGNVAGLRVRRMTKVSFGASLTGAPFWSRSLGGEHTPGSVRRARPCRLVGISGVLTPLFNGRACPLPWKDSQSLWVQDWPSELRPQRCLCPRRCGEWASAGSLLCDFCFGETIPQPPCDCPPGCCGVAPTGSPWWPCILGRPGRTGDVQGGSWPARCGVECRHWQRVPGGHLSLPCWTACSGAPVASTAGPLSLPSVPSPVHVPGLRMRWPGPPRLACKRRSPGHWLR